MSGKLSIVLTVCNAERTLADQLDEVFEVLADLADRFEVLVVDQGSVDQTEDVGRELSMVYPQLRFVRQRRGEAFGDAAVAGLRAPGPLGAAATVYLHGGHLPVRPSHLRRLCEQHATTAVRSRDGTG